MVKVWITYADGVFSMRLATFQQEAETAWIPEHTWRAYNAFLDQCRLWNDIISNLDPHN